MTTTTAALVLGIAALVGLVILVVLILTFCGELLAHWRGEDF